MPNKRICPKCPDSILMNPTSDMGAIPSLEIKKCLSITIEKGFYIDIFSCPKCGFVELYHVDPEHRRDDSP
jgi:predicted nucleic-acid-binding Zn-ribbon protein